MKLLKLLITLIFIALIGGFVFFAFTDVKITQTEVSKEIPHEQLFED
jgi:hypothetical protein